MTMREALHLIGERVGVVEDETQPWEYLWAYDLAVLDFERRNPDYLAAYNAACDSSSPVDAIASRPEV